MANSNILICVNQFGWPDAAATAQLLCQALKDVPSGWRVEVLQGRSRYSGGVNDVSPPRVSIRKLWTPEKISGRSAGRLLGMFVFYVQVGFLLLCKPKGADLLVMTSPPFLVWLGAIAKVVRGGKLVSWEMDVYPELLFRVGVVAETGVVGRALRRLTRMARERVDLTIVLGPCMASLMKEGGAKNVVEVQNWACGDRLFPVSVPGSRPDLVVLYSGNLGVAHDVDTIVRSIPKLLALPISFVFAGSGKRLSSVEEISGGRVSIRGPWAFSELNQALNRADIGLVTQSRASVGCVVPSKFYGVIAAGRPVLFIGSEEATVGKLIVESRCGWVVGPGDVDSLITLLRRLQMNRFEVTEAGVRARALFEERFREDLGVRKFWQVVSMAVGQA